MARATAELSTGLVCGSLLVASLLSCHGQGGSDDFCSDVPPDVPGFAICGAQDGDRAEGRPGGDLNGDGLTDIIVETHVGAAYVVFGKSDGAPVRLAELAEGQGITIDESASEGDLMVMPATDVNGDGFDDLYVMAGGEASYEGGTVPDVYVVFGSPDIRSVDLSALAPAEGRRLFAGEFADASWMEPLGDVNGDGFADLAVIEGTCCFLDINVIFGSADPQEVTVADVEAEIGGFVVARAGWTDVAAGDVNGDGFSDIVVEVIGDSLEGAAHDGPLHVIFGGPDLHELDLDLEWDPVTGEYGAPSFDGYTIFGPEGLGEFDIATGADINGDGLDDLALVLDLTCRRRPGRRRIFVRRDPSRRDVGQVRRLGADRRQGRVRPHRLRPRGRRRSPGAVADLRLLRQDARMTGRARRAHSNATMAGTQSPPITRGSATRSPPASPTRRRFIGVGAWRGSAARRKRRPTRSGTPSTSPAASGRVGR